jgi:hypothetical protein
LQQLRRARELTQSKPPVKAAVRRHSGPEPLAASSRGAAR